VILIGHSKGCVDIASLISDTPAAERAPIGGAIFLQGPIRGTSIVNILNSKKAVVKAIKKMANAALKLFFKGSISAYKDLSVCCALVLFRS
jgi:hypothetical protein